MARCWETDIEFLKAHDGSDYTCLKLLTDVERKHPDAWRTYEMIAGIDCRPRKLGFSVGCLYVDATPRTTTKGIYTGFDVFEVLPVEFSVVTMPANRLAWIENIAVDLMEKGIVPISKSYARKGIVLNKDLAFSQPMMERITDWMDFGPMDGPKLEKLALYFEKKYGIIYARMPRSGRNA
jgi:hypothetical protein